MPTAEQPLSEALEVTSLNPCIETGSLAEAVTDWLERETVDSRLRVRVTAARETTFSIQLGDQAPLVRGFQDLPGDCASQESAIALSIALAIDAVAPPPKERRSRQWRAGAAITLTTPLPENVALGGHVALGRHAVGALWLEIAGLAALASDQVLRDDLPVRFDAALVAAKVSACVHLPLTPALEGQGCAGPWVGATLTRGSGLSGERTESELWLAAASTLGLHLALTPGVGIQVAADLALPLRSGTVRAMDPGGGEVRRDLPGLLAAFRVGPMASF